METIYIAGFSGVGKSIIGRLLSSRKELKFVDTDKLVAEKENMTINEIYNTKGPTYLAEIEKYIIKNSITQGSIVSLGTNIPIDEENRMTIKKSGRVIYLRAKAETICNNLKEEYVDRPFLKNNFTILTVENKINELKPYYEELANFVVDVDNKNINTVFKETLAIYNYANKVKCHIYIK